MTRSFALAAVLIVCGAQASAQSDSTATTHQLDATVVVAHRIATDLRASTAAVSVITRADLERTQARTLPEALRYIPGLVFTSRVSVSFAIADAITRGFDIFGERFVKTGDFDRLLVRPRSTVLQLLGYELRATRIGRLAQGMLAWGVAVNLLTIDLSWQSWAILSFAVAGGVALFSGILVLQATLAFWTVESLEVANTLTYG